MLDFAFSRGKTFRVGACIRALLFLLAVVTVRVFDDITTQACVCTLLPNVALAVPIIVVLFTCPVRILGLIDSTAFLVEMVVDMIVVAVVLDFASSRSGTCGFGAGIRALLFRLAIVTVRVFDDITTQACVCTLLPKFVLAVPILLVLFTCPVRILGLIDSTAFIVEMVVDMI